MLNNQISKLELIQAQVSFIPEGWELGKVGKALVIKNNFRKPISQEVRASMPGNYPYYGPTKIQGYISDYEQDGVYALIGEDGDHFLKYSTMRQTQFISGKCTVNNHAHIIESSDECDSEWFYIFFKHRNITNFLSRQGAGRFKLNKATLEKLPLLVPPLPEQRKIAKILSTWDKAISTTEYLIDNSKQQKKSLMQQLLTGAHEGKRLLDDSGKPFEGEWEELTVGTVATLTAGGTPSTKHPEYWGGEIPWMNSGEINLKQVCSVEGRITELGLKKSSTKEIPLNSILIALAGQGKTRGTVAINRIKLCTNQSIAAIMPNEQKLDSEFLYFNLDGRYKELRAMSTGDGGRGGLNLSILKSIKLKLPTIEEQQKIATVLTNADKEIEILQKQLADLKQEKKALMQQLLTGKRRVTINENSQPSSKAETYENINSQDIKLKKLVLNNFRGFENFIFNFSNSNLSVIIGNNGIGKSSVLEATAIGLSGLIAKIKTTNGKAASLGQSDIKNGTLNSVLEIELEDIRRSSVINYLWKIAESRLGHDVNEDGNYVQLSHLAETYRRSISKGENTSLPLIVYYGVDRASKAIKLNPLKSKYERFDAFESPVHKSANCNDIFDWIHYRDNIQNERNIGSEKLINLEKILRASDIGELAIQESLNLMRYKDPILDSVKKAIKRFIPEITDFSVEREPEIQVYLIKNGIKVYANQLSQGEKGLFCLVSDIARRLSILNPDLKDPLSGSGIILVDEIELHLHPAWQQQIVNNLIACFPNIQFILTTHSPQVLTTARRENIRILSVEDGIGESKVPVGSTYAESSGDMLERVMKVDSRPPLEEVKLYRNYMKMVDGGKYDTSDAKKIREELEGLIGKEHPDLVKADRSIKRQEYLNK